MAAEKQWPPPSETAFLSSTFAAIVTDHYSTQGEPARFSRKQFPLPLIISHIEYRRQPEEKLLF